MESCGVYIFVTTKVRWAKNKFETESEEVIHTMQEQIQSLGRADKPEQDQKE